MSRQSSLVPTCIRQWVQLSGQPYKIKYILESLWSCIYIGCAGLGLVPIDPFAAELGLPAEEILDGLKILQKIDLITFDEKTGEVFLHKWYSYHDFKTSKGYSILLGEIAKIESNKIREVVMSKIPSTPTYTNTLNGKPAQPTQKPVAAPLVDEIDEQTGVIIRTNEDRSQLANIVKKHGALKIKSCVYNLTTNDFKRPFISNIITQLKVKRAGLNQYPDDEIDEQSVLIIT
jgi:hypothetical protein